MGMRLGIMCATKFNRTGGALRIEAVDNWHRRWTDVLRAVEKQGTVKRLSVDADGWLSARQVLLVAFAGDSVAAHVCFSVSPGRKGCIEAKLDSHGIDGRFCDRGIESQLHQAALDRAKSLRCEKLKGFRLNSNWC